MRKIFSLTIITLLIMSSFLLIFEIQFAKADGTIYIRASGAVEPSSAPILTSSALISTSSTPELNAGTVYYTFTADISDSIVVERDNIVIDGAGYTLQGAKTGTGVSLNDQSNVIITNMTISDFSCGIYFYNCDDNSIVSNNITDNNDGIIFHSGSQGNIISANNITSNSNNGIQLNLACRYNSISENTIANSTYGISIDEWASPTSIFANNITYNNVGVLLRGGVNSKIWHNNFVVNTQHVYNPAVEVNIWDDGYPSGGNYWSDYNGTDEKNGPNQDMPGSDRIGDSTYVIDANNVDRYPLMAPFPSLLTPLPPIVVPDDYPTIQEAVDAAPAGSTVLVHAGVYNESVTIYKLLTVVSQSGPLGTIISFPDSFNPDNASLLEVMSPYVTISGFTLTAATGAESSAILLNGVMSCNISNNVCYGNDIGINLLGAHDNAITNNNVSANQKGIHLQMANHNLILNNTISNNSLGLHLEDCSNNTIYHNNFVNNTQQTYIYQSNSVWDDGRRSGGNYWNDYTGIDADNDGLGDTPYVIDANNTDRYPLMDPFGSVPTPVRPIIVPDDYPSIQGAIDAADVGDTIFVRNGTYYGSVSSWLNVNKAVALIGENRESTIIAGSFLHGLEISADNVTVTGFTASAVPDAGSGIKASNVKGINVSGNIIVGAEQGYGMGLELTSVSNSTFSENRIISGGASSCYGLSMVSSSFNTFLGDNFSSCNVVSSSNNIFSGNHITGDAYHTLDISNSTNSWNGTYPAGGNYWKDYADVDLKKGPDQDQLGGDGFGDTPYVLDANNTDYYPLMRPYTYFTEGIPFAYFNYTPNRLAGETVTFDASASIDLNGNIVNYAWDFGDGTNATSANPVATHAYGNVHSNSVKLTVTDNDGLTDTTTQIVTVGMIPASISIATSASSLFAGFKVDIAGALRDVYGNALIGKTVVLSYTFSGADTWTPITSSTTDNAGNYAATWIPTATGAFTLKATWSGTDTVSAADSNTTLNCLSYDQYVFSIESNSTVSGLAFNAAEQTLSFTAAGADGTGGYVRAAVAKNLAANPAGIKVFIDGSQIACSPTSTSDSYLLYLTYQHSTHTVLIDLSAAAAEPTPTPTPSSTATPTPTPTTSATPQPTVTPTPTSNPTATPQPDEIPLTNWLLILLIAVVITVVIIAVILVWKRRKS